MREITRRELSEYNRNCWVYDYTPSYEEIDEDFLYYEISGPFGTFFVKVRIPGTLAPTEPSKPKGGRG